MKIYLASSWRNKDQPDMVKFLRELGYSVYDFKKDGTNFHWSDIDLHWKSWRPVQYRDALLHSLAKKGFAEDMAALKWCDVCVLLQPAGKSASFEMGWAMGAGKPCIMHVPVPIDPELMFKDAVFTTTLVELKEALVQAKQNLLQ